MSRSKSDYPFAFASATASTSAASAVIIVAAFGFPAGVADAATIAAGGWPFSAFVPYVIAPTAGYADSIAAARFLLVDAQLKLLLSVRVTPFILCPSVTCASSSIMPDRCKLGRPRNPIAM